MREIQGVTFLVEGDDLERGGVVEPGHVGLRLNCGTEITDTKEGMEAFTMALAERFILDPRVVIVGNPVDGFEYYGPSPLNDPGEYLNARTRLIEERDGGDWWSAPLRPVSDLDPIDSGDEPLMTFAEVKAAARGWQRDGGDGYERRYGGGAVGKVRLCDGEWTGWVEYFESEDGPSVDGDTAAAAMAEVDEAYAERPRR